METLFTDYPTIEYEGLNYTTSDINKNFKIKVSGISKGERVHKLVGVSGLLELVGLELANSLLEKAFEKGLDKVECKLRRGLKITFYTI